MINSEIAFIALVILIQIGVFIRVLAKIDKFKKFFLKDFNLIKIKKYHVPNDVLNNPIGFDDFINKVSVGSVEDNSIGIEESQLTDLMVINNDIKESNPFFNEVIHSTNSYLLKNRGSSADFNILQDICDRHVEKQDNSIGNLINVPLYIGLGGTFLGIIFGLWGINFTSETGSMDTTSVQDLLNGVIGAMVASLFGLGLTVVSSAWKYKDAVYENDSDKNMYYDFIQRELLPVLNIGMAGSLSSFRSVLDHFIIKFGENIEDYGESASRLNENLQLQYSVLEEINKLSLTKTATKISEVFMNLNESSEHLNTFKEYQVVLNQKIDTFSNAVGDMQTMIQNFSEFNASLNNMSAGLNKTFELQSQFKNSLETHFPTVRPAQEVWRSHVDELNIDIKNVYSQLNDYFKQSSDNIQLFIKNNDNFFNGLNDIQNSIKVFVDNSNLQTEQYKLMKDEMKEMRIEMRKTNESTLDLNKDLIDAIKDLSSKISNLKS